MHLKFNLIRSSDSPDRAWPGDSAEGGPSSGAWNRYPTASEDPVDMLLLWSDRARVPHGICGGCQERDSGRSSWPGGWSLAGCTNLSMSIRAASARLAGKRLSSLSEVQGMGFLRGTCFTDRAAKNSVGTFRVRGKDD